MDKLLQHADELMWTYGLASVKSALVVIAALVIYALFCRAVRRVGDKGYLDGHLSIILGNIVKWLLVAVTILLLLGFFGVSVGALWATLSGILALIALGFVAVWSVMSNVFCSILLIIFPPFRIGDQIEIQEPTASFSVKGKVISINMLMTSLEMEASAEAPADSDPVIMRIPNNIFFQKYVRCVPGKKTESLKKYVARQQQVDSQTRSPTES